MTGLTRRQFARNSLTAGAIATLMAAVSSCSADTVTELTSMSVEPERIRVDWSFYNPVGLGLRDQGFLERDPATSAYEVDWIQTGNESQSIDAAASKSLLVATTSGSALMRSRALGLPIVAIAVASEPNWSAIFSGPTSPVKQPKDLKGRRVAVQGGGESFYYLCRLLFDLKLTLKDITPVFLDPIAGMNSMIAGTVDAWCGMAPYTNNAVFQGQHIVHREPLWGTHCYLVTHQDNLKAHAPLLQAIVDQYQTARKWLFFNQAQLSQRLVSLTGMPAEPILRSIADSNSFVDRVPTGGHQLRLIEAANVLETAGEIDSAGRNAAIKGSLNTTFAKRAPAIDFVKLQAELVG